MKVICITDELDDLTLGKIYDVVLSAATAVGMPPVATDYYEIINDFGDLHVYFINRFKTVDENRDDKLNQIL